MRKEVLFAIFLLSTLGLASAHQPRLVSNGITQIQNPEVSQAFYAELNGEPGYYQIISNESFNFYIQILVPDIPNIGKDVSVEVTYGDEPLFLLDGTNHTWIWYFEEFAGDSYYQGPEEEAAVEPGTYNIRVFSPDNEGKYVLVVGRIESFPADEIINTLFLLPQLKADFFGKPAYTAYFNLVGLFIFGPVILVIVVILILILRRKRK